MTEFLAHAVEIIKTHPPIDRTLRNLSALVIASLAVADLIEGLTLRSVDIDEARFSGTASEAKMEQVVISQFDCRGGDLSQVEFINCTLLTLIADAETLLPDHFPSPVRLHDISAGGGTITDPELIDRWINDHLRNPPERKVGLIPPHLRDHEAIRVLSKACRIRQYWLRHGDDVYASRILDNEYWPGIEKALSENDLLRVEHRQASGTNARFIHVRQPDDILRENEENSDVRRFYRDLVNLIEPRTDGAAAQ